MEFMNDNNVICVEKIVSDHSVLSGVNRFEEKILTIKAEIAKKIANEALDKNIIPVRAIRDDSILGTSYKSEVAIISRAEYVKLKNIESEMIKTRGY